MNDLIKIDDVTPILAVVIGWILGYVGTVLQSNKQRKRELLDYRNAIRVELKRVKTILGHYIVHAVQKKSVRDTLENIQSDEIVFTHFTKISLVAINSNITKIGQFQNKFQIDLFDVIWNIHCINQLIKRSEYYFKQTFDETLSQENHKAVNINIGLFYDEIISYCEKTIVIITRLELPYTA